MNELDVIRSVNFDWAMRLSEVWSQPVWDTPELHSSIRSEFARKLEVMGGNPRRGRPWVGSLSGAEGPARRICWDRSDVRQHRGSVPSFSLI